MRIPCWLDGQIFQFFSFDIEDHEEVKDKIVAFQEPRGGLARVFFNTSYNFGEGMQLDLGVDREGQPLEERREDTS